MGENCGSKGGVDVMYCEWGKLVAVTDCGWMRHVAGRAVVDVKDCE